MAATENDGNGLNSPLAIMILLPTLILLSVRLFSADFILAPQVALHLDGASRMLAGQKPYLDFWDWSQPALLALYSVPQLVAGLIPHFLSISDWTKLILWVLTLGSLTLSLLIVRRLECFSAVALALGCANLSVCSQFGSTQHLLMLALTPWILMRWATGERLNSSLPLQLLIAGLIAYACALDLPHLAVLLWCEGFFFLRYGLVKQMAQQLLILALALLVIWGLTLMDTSIWQSYWQWTIPLRLAQYKYFDSALKGTTVPDHANFLYLFALVQLAAFYLSDGKNRSAANLSGAFASLALAGLTLFIAEGEGLSCDIVIVVYATVFLLSLLLVTLVRRNKLTASKPVLIASLSIVSIALPICILSVTAKPAVPVNLIANQNIDQTILKLSSDGDQIGIFAEYPDVAYPRLERLHRKSSGYLLWARPLRMLCDFQQGKRLTDDQFSFQTYFMTKIAEDFVSGKASLILVEEPKQSELLAFNGLDRVLHKNYLPAGNCQVFAEPYGLTNFSVWRRK